MERLKLTKLLNSDRVRGVLKEITGDINKVPRVQITYSLNNSTSQFRQLEANQQHYGQSSMQFQSNPPSYVYTKIKNDIFLYWSDDDWLADPEDVKEYLLTSLNPNFIKLNNHLSDYNHLDFIWGMNAA
ncbi:hypothetical protein PRIPAC_80241, partial [Pristionchus pacificus]|uniref:Uncharacterized protein n=1 Tax=Pristionchus pacificus TaxID=54126 RepID=A0A2A6CNR4_PRIPA